MCCTDELYVRLGRVVCAARMSYMCGTDDLCTARVSCMCGSGEIMCCTDEFCVRHG